MTLRRRKRTLVLVRLAILSQISVLFLSIVLVITITSPEAGATTWGPEQEISSDFLLQPQDSPSIAVDGDNVYLVWRDFGPNYDWDGDSEIYFRQFNGTSWQPIEEISRDILQEPQHSPAIAAENGKVHVVWVTEENVQHIDYRCFNGTDWQPEERIYTAALPESQPHLSIAVDGSNVHVVWENIGGLRTWEDIYHLHYDGLMWNPAQEISTDLLDETQKYPSIAAENGEVHVVWNDYKNGDSDIYYRYYDGKRWDPELEISTDVGNESQWGPHIAVEGGKLHVVWIDNGDGDWDIFYRHFDGTDWQPQQEISTDMQSEGQVFPSVAVNGGKVHVAWHESQGNGFIKYRNFNGTAWMDEQVVSEGGKPWLQRGTAVAADGDRVHVAWTDSADGYGDIYYRRAVEDLTAPGSNAKPISPYWKTTTTFNVYWLATDDCDLANIYLYYRYSPDHISWSAWEEWSYDNTVSGTLATGSFSFVAPYGVGHYQFYTIASDTSLNTEAAKTLPDASAGIDMTPPTGSIIINNGDQWTTSASVTLALEYSDSMSGVHEVRYGNDDVWDTEPWESPSTTKTWALIPGDGTKTVHYQIEDNAGLTVAYSDDIEMDTATPTGSIVINNDDEWTDTTSVTLALTYADSMSGVYRVRYSNDGVWDTEPWEPPSTIKPWILAPGDGMKTVYYQVLDYAGIISPEYSDDIGLDSTEPTGSIVINGGSAWTDSVTVTLSMDYSDLTSGVGQVRHSNDGVWDTEPWELPFRVKAWTLTSGDGTKTVYFQVRDFAGKESITYSDDIGLDTTPPTGSIVIDNSEEWTTSTSVTLTVTFSDSLSGVSQVRFRNDGVWDTEPWESPSSTKAWALSAGDGMKEVYYQIKDNAGKESVTYSDVIGLDTTPPTGCIVIENGLELTNSTSVTLSLTYSDDLSGVSKVRYSNDGFWDTESWESPTTTRAWMLADGYGIREVYFQLKDEAGLVSTYADDIAVRGASEEPLGPEDDPIILPTVVTVVTVCTITAVIFSIFEWAKYLLLSLFVPLYTKLKRENVLDHETRGMIRGYVIANPGDHFNAIKKALGLKNGTLAHHLSILERESFVRSVRDGKYRRFFPVGARVSEGAFPTKIEKLILEILEETPGRTQKEIARRLGVSQPAVSYHVRKLEKLDMIIAKKHRIALRYYVNNSP